MKNTAVSFVSYLTLFLHGTKCCLLWPLELGVTKAFVWHFPQNDSICLLCFSVRVVSCVQVGRRQNSLLQLFLVMAVSVTSIYF